MEKDDEARAGKRSGNERMERLARSYHFDATQRVPFICECADRNCREIVMLSLADYDAVRVHANGFFLVAGHEDADATRERILEAEQGYTVVEKLGTAGVEGEGLDPRDPLGES